MIDKIIENVPSVEKEMISCGFFGLYHVIETEKLRICFLKSNKQCEIIRLANNNPVLFRYDSGRIYRMNKGIESLKKELYRLAEMPYTARNFDYD